MTTHPVLPLQEFMMRSPYEVTFCPHPRGLFHAVEEIFPYEPHKSSCSLKNTWARASENLLDATRTVMLPKADPLSRASCPLWRTLPSAGFSGLCATILDALRSPSHHLNSRICNKYCHPIGYSGWESKCHMYFGAKENWVSHLTSKDSVSSPLKNWN